MTCSGEPLNAPSSGVRPSMRHRVEPGCDLVDIFALQACGHAFRDRIPRLLNFGVAPGDLPGLLVGGRISLSRLLHGPHDLPVLRGGTRTACPCFPRTRALCRAVSPCNARTSKRLQAKVFSSSFFDSRLGGQGDVITVPSRDVSGSRKAAVFIEAIGGINRTYGIGETITQFKESCFGEIADSIPRECILYPVPGIMDDGHVFRLPRTLRRASPSRAVVDMDRMAPEPDPDPFHELPFCHFPCGGKEKHEPCQVGDESGQQEHDPCNEDQEGIDNLS